MTVFTMILWAGCLATGLLGFAISNQQLAATVPPVAGTPTQMIDVDVMRDMTAHAEIRPNALEPIPKSETAIPALPAVIAPSPAIAFEQPVDSRVLRPLAQIEQLTYGQGEGRQPRPDYPMEARLAQQEGVVLVRFTVGEDGRVISAEAIQPCPWPILNQAAVRSVRETWNFRPGSVRTYEVSIQYQINRH